MKKITLEQLEKIKELRQQGWSVPEIAQVIPVSKTTVLRYCRLVKIFPEFIDQWAGKRGGSHKKRLEKEAKALEDGKLLIGQMTDKEKILFISALYWAEGNKKDFGLSNTDPLLIKIFVNWLKKTLGVNDDRIRISIRLYEDLDRDKCLTFWSEVVEIPKEKFHSINTLAGKKKGKLEYGMCRVRVLEGGDLLKKLMGINRAIGELPL